MADDFSLALMERILKSKGAERVSKLSKKRMASILKGYAEKIALLAVKNAAYSGRVTITLEDITEAKKSLR